MTEEEWLACSIPVPLLDHLGTGTSQRKCRLFVVACCRNIWQSLHDYSRTAVEISERLADGLATNTERRAAALACEGHSASNWRAQAAASCTVGMLPPRLLRLVLEHARCGATDAVVSVVFGQELTTEEAAARVRASTTECIAQACLIRDIFGNPFRPVTVEPAWLTSDVVALARGIYDDRAFDRMPILADALQEAGCDNADVLDHCRGDGPHVRGCWVVDLLLGKS